jgi:hypothetical protein
MRTQIARHLIFATIERKPGAGDSVRDAAEYRG